MHQQTRTRYIAFAAAIGGLLISSPGHAQSVEDFYRGKTINLIIGYSVGGGYDLYGRLVARYLGRHIPGQPTIVPQNREGAGSMRVSHCVPQDYIGGKICGNLARSRPRKSPLTSTTTGKVFLSFIS